MNNRELKTIIKMFEESSLSKIRLVKEDVTIELEKPTEHQVISKVVEPQTTREVVQDQQPLKADETTSNFTPVNAPLVGTFYEAPAPDQPPFVREGQQVKQGDTLFIIEAMKVMNEITAPKNGIVKKIHVQNGDMVMYDQVVLEIA